MTGELGQPTTAASVGSLAKRIKDAANPLDALDLCVQGGEQLIERRPNIPRRVLKLADACDDPEIADAARTGIVRSFPEILDLRDLSWLRRLGHHNTEKEVIHTILATGDFRADRLANMVTRLAELGDFPTFSQAFDHYAHLGVTSAKFQARHYRALLLDRRNAEAEDLFRRLKKSDFDESDWSFFQQKRKFFADEDNGFEDLSAGLAASEPNYSAAYALNAIAKALDSGKDDAFDGWRSLEKGIIYRPGCTDQALVFFTGPQTIKNADSLALFIDACRKFGVGQVLLHRRLDRYLTGMGPWDGRPEVTIHRLQARLAEVGIHRLATMGNSGTSLAATIAAAEVNADAALLIPAVTHYPNPDTEPDKRAARASARELAHLPTGEYDALPYLAGKSVQIWAHLPAQSDFDKRQLAHISEYPNLVTIPHELDNHALLSFLRDKGLLETSLKQFLGGIGWLAHQSAEEVVPQ